MLPASIVAAAALALAPSAPAVVIDQPRDGARMHEWTTVVRGIGPSAPRGGSVDVIVSVNGRRLWVEPSGRRFRATVVLAPGANRIVARALVYGPDEDADPVVVDSAPLTVTRVRRPGTSALNLATAYWAADGSYEVYCGEGDCRTEPFCVRVGSARIDCPIKWRFPIDRPPYCNGVLAYELRGRRIYTYRYACSGRWDRNSRSFVRSDVRRAGHRLRVGEEYADEINEPNRYGIPRFDARRDLFIP